MFAAAAGTKPAKQRSIEPSWHFDNQDDRPARRRDDATADRNQRATMIKHILAVLTLLLACGLHATPARAQSSRTFVSASGNDANNCDRPTPCRTFQGAHDKTNDQGEITVLDPGSYGNVTITKSISIVNDGVGEAGIVVSGNAMGIIVDGGAATSVNLRGLTVQGVPLDGSLGVQFRAGRSLTITNCVFRNHTGIGIDFIPNGSGASSLAVSNTLVADNGNQGIFIGSVANATVQAVIDRVRMVNNSQNGLAVSGGFSTGGAIKVAVTDSVSANNGAAGYGIFSIAGTPASLMLMRSAAANNSVGVEAGNAATVLRLGRSSITGNGTTARATGGAIVQSFGDNAITDNADGNPALPTIARK
jgi:Right handed beta helix region